MTDDIWGGGWGIEVCHDTCHVVSCGPWSSSSSSSNNHYYVANANVLRVLFSTEKAFDKACSPVMGK